MNSTWYKKYSVSNINFANHNLQVVLYFECCSKFGVFHIKDLFHSNMSVLMKNTQFFWICTKQNPVGNLGKDLFHSNAGRRTKFAPWKSLDFSDSDSDSISVLLCSFMNPPLQFFQTAKGKAPKEAGGEHLSGCGINVTPSRAPT